MIKKFYLSILTLTALLCFGTGNAWGDELTVAEDATSYERYLPFDGYNCDAAQHNQFIIPASELTTMIGSDIAGMKFYTKAASYTWQGNSPVFTIKLAEVEASTQTGLINTTFTQVYAGQASFASYAWDITFDDAYNYHGGNLLVDISSPAAGYVKGNGTTGSEFAYVSRTNGGYGQYAVRAYMPKITFTYEAPSLCAKPELTFVGMTNTSASFSWSGGSAWEYLCLPAATTLTDEHWASATQTTNTSAIVDGLIQGASYNFYLRADCGTDGKSKVVNAAFSTASKVAPWSEDFDAMTTSTVPTDWDNSGSASSTAAGSSKYYVWGVYQPSGGSKMIRMYNNMVQSGSALINTPAIYLPEGAQYELKFDYSQRSNCTTFVVKVSTDGGKTFTKIAPASADYYDRTASNNTGTPGDFTTETISLNSYVGKSIILQFYSVATYNGGSIFVDNVLVKVASSCTAPSGVSAAATAYNQASVSWTEAGSATTWNIQYSTDNFSTHTDINGVTDNPYELTGLSGNTTYKVRVQADCGAEQSDFVASEAFETPCEPTTGIGWSANFAGASTGSAAGLPSCWVKNSTNSYPYIYQYGARSNSRCLYFSAGSGVKPIAVLPPFSEATNTLYVTLWYNNAYDYGDYCSESHGQLEIGFMTNPADASTFTAQEVLPRVCTYTQAKVALTNAPEGSRVAIRYVGGSTTGYAFVDDIAITAIPSCVAPSGVAGSATDVDEASISWTANGSETAWKITYSSDNGETWSDAVNAGTNPFILTGLSAKTTYIAKVKAKCGEEEFSEWSAPSLPFSTPCPPQAASYSFGFETAEGAVNGAFPTSECWKRITTSSYPVVYNYYAKSGSQCLRFYGSGTQYAILPQFNEDVKGLALSFYYYNDSWGGALSVGYMTDPEDASTFVLVQDLANITSYAAAATEINLSGADAGARYIAFKYVGSESYHASYLDDVVVEKALSCQKPTDVEASNVTATTADVAWTENNSATTWKLQISNDGSAWTDVNGGADITTNPYQLTGLTPNHTTYYVRVKSVCGSGEDESSNWSAPSAPFETECGARSLPFNEDFGGANLGCWTKELCYANTGLNNGTFMFYYNNVWNSEVPPQYLISPEINTENKPVTVEFDYYMYSGTETFKVGYSTTTNDVSAFTWGNEISCTNMSSTNPDSYSENFPAGVKYVAIMHTSDDQHYLYIDNFSVTEYVAPACPAVSAATLEESDVTAHTATVSWTAGGEETAWNLQYKAAGGEWSDVIAISTTPSYDLAGLAENTLYYVRVQADCAGDGTGDWTGDEAFSFPTDCEPKAVSKASPWECNFDDAENNKMPSCWERVEPYDGYGYPYVDEYAYYASSGTKYLYFRVPGRSGSSYTEEAILPVFNTEIKNLKVSFQYKNNSTGTRYGQLAIGYIVGNTFTQVGELVAQNDDDYVSVEREMPNDAPDGARIAIRCIGGSYNSSYTTYAYVDDVVVSLKPTCYVPTALAAAETSDGAVLTWTAGKDENEWSVRYSVKDADTWTTINEIATNSYTLTGLSVGTTYEVQVKAVCGVGDESEWSASAEFEPVCNAPSALAVTARTQNSASFSWTSSESAWVLQYSVDGENWESENVAANPFTLNGLSAGTTYQAKIQSACGSDFSNIVMFTTWCDSKLSLPTNLTSFSAIPACWEESPAGAVSIASSKLCFVGEGEKFLYLPQTDVNLNLLSATFTFSGSLEFGYIDAPNGAFQAFETQPTSGVELNMEGEVAAAKYIAIRYNGASNLSQASISAVSIRKTPTCLAPTAVEATPGVGSASISWTNGGSEEAWNLQYKLASVASWDGAAQVAVSAKPFELSGLEQGVSYKVRVQAACAGEDPSDWSDEASFITDCEGIAALPWYADFSVALSACWTIHAESSSSYYIPAANTAMNQLKMDGGKNGNSNNVVVLPAFSADLSDAVLSLEYKNGLAGANYAKLEIGYVTDKNDASTFVIIGEAWEQSTSFTEARVALADVTSGRQIALRFAGASAISDMSIKNLRVINAYNFADNVDNSGTLAALNGQTVDVTIGRSFLCADYFNTICLPFSLSAEELAASPIASEDLWAFKYARVEGGELLIRIVEAESINAGEPYLISWPTGDNIENPLFKNVTISASAGKTMGEENLKFVGTLKPETFAAHDDSKLFLYQNNTLYWWAGDAPSNLKSFRAFFTVEGGADSMTIKHMPARIVRGEQVATGVSDVQGNVQSLKLLENDRVVIIRNGVKYSIQGQKIQ